MTIKFNNKLELSKFFPSVIKMVSSSTSTNSIPVQAPIMVPKLRLSDSLRKAIKVFNELDTAGTMSVVFLPGDDKTTDVIQVLIIITAMDTKEVLDSSKFVLNDEGIIDLQDHLYYFMDNAFFTPKANLISPYTVELRMPKHNMSVFASAFGGPVDEYLQSSLKYVDMPTLRNWMVALMRRRQEDIKNATGRQSIDLSLMYCKYTTHLTDEQIRMMFDNLGPDILKQ